MWRAISGLMNTGHPVRQDVTLQNYFTRTYVGTICPGIRREGDAGAQTSSLARCLDALIDHPEVMTRERFAVAAAENMAGAGADVHEGEIARAFETFAPHGGDRVDPQVPARWLRELRQGVAPVKKYTDKVLAHRDKGGDVEELIPTWDAINGALDAVGLTMKRLHGLRHPLSQLAQVTPVPSPAFVEMFKVPWYSAEWRPPPDADQF
jgi:hypothetical protein